MDEVNSQEVQKLAHIVCLLDYQNNFKNEIRSKRS